MKGAGMLVVSHRGANFRILVSLDAIIFCTQRNIKIDILILFYLLDSHNQSFL